MSNEILKIDANNKTVAGFVTDDASQEIRNARIDDDTKGLKVMIVGGSGMGTVTSVATGTGLTGGPITTTGTISLNTKLAPLDTLGTPLQSIRVNTDGTALEYYTPSSGTGTVTSVSIVSANGISGTVATATTTPAITLSLGAITPTTVNGNTITTGTGTLTLAAGKTLTVNGNTTLGLAGYTADNNGGIIFTASKVLTIADTASISGTNTGDNTIATGLTGTPSITVNTVTTTGNIELGNASDTTLARVSAGVVSIEGVNIVTAGSITTDGITMNTGKLLGRSTASTGAIEEITLGTNLAFSGTTLNATGKSNYSCRVYQTGTTSLTSSWVACAFAAEDFDTDTMHDNSTNNTRITFTHAGTYLVGGTININTNVVSGARIKLGGTTVLAQSKQGNSGSPEGVSISTLYSFTAGQYVELEGYAQTTQNSSGDAQTNFWAFNVA